MTVEERRVVIVVLHEGLRMGEAYWMGADETQTAIADERCRFRARMRHCERDTYPLLRRDDRAWTVTSVDDFGCYTAYPAGWVTDPVNAVVLAGLNDGEWADLMDQVGVPRHPRFAVAGVGA